MYKTIKLTNEEEVAMYMKSTKLELIKMLIECNKQLIKATTPLKWTTIPNSIKESRSVCPVCGGNGLVPHGYYVRVGNEWSTTDITPEKCKSCNGTGII